MEIQDIKSHLEILQVLRSYNLKPNKNNILRCPFHENDKTPSLKIYTKTNTFFCFSCGATGDQIQFVEMYEKLNKHESIIKAKSMITPGATTLNNKTVVREDKQVLPRIAVLNKIAQDSKTNFKRTALPQDYLKSRNLDITKLDVGYISNSFGKGWNKQLKESGLKLGILKQSRQNTLVPRFNHVVVFFTRNEKGQIIDLYGRSINKNTESRHFYLNGHHQGIYPGYPKQETKRLILTESFIDCETLLQQEEISKHYSIISLFGTNGLTKEIEQAILNLPELEEIILFLDGDGAGQEATKTINEKLLKLKPGTRGERSRTMKITVVDTPKDEDVNSLLNGHEPEILLHLINKRQIVSIKNKNEQRNDEQVPPEPGSVPNLNTSNPDKIIYETTELRFTIWGGIEKHNMHRLKVNLLCELKSDSTKYYQDDVNLYSNTQLQRFTNGTAEELESSTTTIKETLRKLKIVLGEYRLQQIDEEKKALQPKLYQMSKPEQQQAMKLLKSKNLVQNTIKSIDKSGLVGEQKNGLLLFFLYLSRLMDEPLHAIIFGKSGSGKTYLQTKISECLPEESVRTITSLTENTLYYSAKGFWKHKVLLIEDLEGVYNAFLPLREFMSKQSITKLTTDKDAKGNNVQKALHVEGPICVSGATTQGSIYEDNANRSYLLHIDESTGHLKEVMNFQRMLQAGMVNEKEQDQYRLVLKNAQRLLRKIKVINPYATQLEIPDCVFKKLRTNMHYLKLIEIITFYHQHQRRRVAADNNGVEYIETTLEDIEWANYLVKDTLLRKSDELSGQLRLFFENLKRFASKKEEPKNVYAKEVREIFRLNPMRVNRYLRDLENRGYIERTGGNRKTGFEYEIKAWDEYDNLKSNINILDEILQRIKSKKACTERSRSEVDTERSRSIT